MFLTTASMERPPARRESVAAFVPGMRGRGYGRTSIRLETDRLVQIRTQGIADGLPFEYSAEARRVGDCGA